MILDSPIPLLYTKLSFLTAMTQIKKPKNFLVTSHEFDFNNKDNTMTWKDDLDNP